MTFQARRLLKKLKKAQIEQDRIVYIDFDEMKAVTVHDVTETTKTIDLGWYRKSIHSTLRYLAENDYIEKNDSGYIKVLHPGWYWGQTMFGKFMNFLFTSIVVPIFVSVVTSIIVTVIALLFQTNP